MRSMIATLFLALWLGPLGGCSVIMAASGEQEPDLGILQVGSTRGEIELQLGEPVNVATMPAGQTVAVYEYEIGDEPSAGRAAGHAAMDVLTLGLWEVFGTPLEAVQGEKDSVTVVYDRSQAAISVDRSGPARREETDVAAVETD